jgi:hypothetical protein
VRKAVEDMEPLEDLEKTWREDLRAFQELRKACLLYE